MLSCLFFLPSQNRGLRYKLFATVMPVDAKHFNFQTSYVPLPVDMTVYVGRVYDMTFNYQISQRFHHSWCPLLVADVT